MKKQGPGPTKKYNAAIRDALEELSPGEAYEGAWRQLEWYNVTDGAVSYDGTHYSYQVRRRGWTARSRADPLRVRRLRWNARRSS